VIVRSPEFELLRVLNNLVWNAAAAVEKNEPDDRRIEVNAWASSTMAFIEVSDNGEGLAVSEGDRVFELFHTTKPTGRGIGLAACRKLVTRWGGTIEVASRTNRGTTFRVSIPTV
jgi:C4-dicarboxylate-specific signal transduction histidine kinase